mmetsp:Transcript_29632/g.89743  ORF Transcript_29632/g.89743 Transcript_29632/m.89743 type:complete len:249 (-) Transcript_29632:243-989(-)
MAAAGDPRHTAAGAPGPHGEPHRSQDLPLRRLRREGPHQRAVHPRHRRGQVGPAHVADRVSAHAAGKAEAQRLAHRLQADLHLRRFRRQQVAQRPPHTRRRAARRERAQRRRGAHADREHAEAAQQPRFQRHHVCRPGPEDLRAQGDLGRPVRALPRHVQRRPFRRVEPSRNRDPPVEPHRLHRHVGVAVHRPHAAGTLRGALDRGLGARGPLHVGWAQARLRKRAGAQRRDRERVRVAPSRGPVHGL